MSQPTTVSHESMATPPAPPTMPRDWASVGRAAVFWPWLRRAAPTAIVIIGLALVAYWGNRSEWTLPKFSALIGTSVSDPEDWCAEHNVPESQCIECHAELAPESHDFGWCKVHGVADCPFEHPEVAQLKTIPRIDPDDLERAASALALRPRSENSSRCQLHSRHVQFASIRALEKAGVDIAVVARHPMIEAIQANGEVVYDETTTAQLASRVSGTVWRVEKRVGDHVSQGEALALIDAAEVGRAKAEFLQSIVQLRLKKTNFERMRPLAEEGSVPGRAFREAESSLQEAEIRLLGAQQTLVNLGFAVRSGDFADLDTEQIAQRMRLLGLPDDAMGDAVSEFITSNLYPLRSPLDGVVISRKAVPGEVVAQNTAIFGVADVRRMWLTLDVRQDDAKYLAIGQTVLFRASDSVDEPEIRGTLAWISTAADDQTRTVKIRANLPNDDGRLRANSFGAGRIVLRAEPRAIVVPSEAVHWDGDCNVVFVRDKHFLDEGSPKFFHVRKVRVGVVDGDATEIIAGLLPGEVIAARNSVVLEAQLLKSGLGAGCGCAEGH